jgi:hypothetical protein
MPFDLFTLPSSHISAESLAHPSKGSVNLMANGGREARG